MKAVPITVYLPDARGVEVSRFGIGNLKLGMGVFTYSRPAGRGTTCGTCPGSTLECETICYAKRITGDVRNIYFRNVYDSVPEIPAEAKLLRIHVSGDFDTVAYIDNWRARLLERPDVSAWAYTRSWRVPSLLPALEELRALPNMQLFASMDPSTSDMPPASWRRAWIWRDEGGQWPIEKRLFTMGWTGLTTPYGLLNLPKNLLATAERGVTPAFVCPEETGDKANCIECGYCFHGQRNDVVFLEHNGQEEK